jgi:RimJ/RimL family protein N-acetyltransferase
MFRAAAADDTERLVRHGYRLRVYHASAPCWVETICRHDGAARFIADFRARSAACEGAAYFLLLEGAIRGGAIYSRLSGVARRFELGVWCEQEFRGRGHFSSGLADISGRITEQLRAEAIVARTTFSNQPAQRMLKRLGFALDEAQLLKGRLTYHLEPM